MSFFYVLWVLFVVSVAFIWHERKEHKPKLLSLDIFRWGRGLPREGVGAKKFDMSFETQGKQLYWRDIPGFCRDIPSKMPEKFEKKVRVQFLASKWCFILMIRALRLGVFHSLESGLEKLTRSS